MFGLREPFRYFECARCGCLYIDRIPEDLSRFYPDGYYAHAPLRDFALKSYVKKRWLEHHGGRPNILGWALTRLRGVPWFPESLRRVSRTAAVLDVGCGTGLMLLQLRDAGFRDLTGVDPYIERDLHYRGGVAVLKRPLADLARVYDVVMLHHSFEHVEDPLETLRDLSRLVAPGAAVLIRMPVARCHAWDLFGTDWVQIDAPRHLIVHSEESMRILAGTAGFEVTEVVYDSTAFQFWGSVQYQHDIPLWSERSYVVNPGRSPFSAAQIRAWEHEAEALNAAGRGDQACFYLRKT
jgi:SAM-dependent methyltransferase